MSLAENLLAVLQKEVRQCDSESLYLALLFLLYVIMYQSISYVYKYSPFADSMPKDC